MTDDYFMLPRFDRRKTIVCNGVAGLFAIGCLIGHTAGVDGVWLGVEASLVLLAMAVLNAVLRVLTRKPLMLEPWERGLLYETKAPHLTAGEIVNFNPHDEIHEVRNFEGKLEWSNTQNPHTWGEDDGPQKLNMCFDCNAVVSHGEECRCAEHKRRNAENARVLAEHLDERSREVYDDLVGANVLPDDRVIDIANSKA